MDGHTLLAAGKLYTTLYLALCWLFRAMAITFRRWLREPLEWKETWRYFDRESFNLINQRSLREVLTKLKHGSGCEVIDEQPKQLHGIN
jgi:hypothetical protein